MSNQAGAALARVKPASGGSPTWWSMLSPKAFPTPGRQTHPPETAAFRGALLGPPKSNPLLLQPWSGATPATPTCLEARPGGLGTCPICSEGHFRDRHPLDLDSPVFPVLPGSCPRLPAWRPPLFSGHHSPWHEVKFCKVV